MCWLLFSHCCITFVGSVEVYKCEPMASTCGQCLTLATDYNCVWCSDQCRIETSCQTLDILARDDVCPDPQILSVSIICIASLILCDVVVILRQLSSRLIMSCAIEFGMCLHLDTLTDCTIVIILILKFDSDSDCVLSVIAVHTVLVNCCCSSIHPVVLSKVAPSWM